MAMTDPLTSAFNRRYLMRHLKREIKRSKRCGGDVSVLLLDIDHFKRINDAHGHDAGDAVLKMLTTQIGACLRRDTDWCARLGGEEFVVVLEGTNLAAARVCAEKLKTTVANSSTRCIMIFLTSFYSGLATLLQTGLTERPEEREMPNPLKLPSGRPMRGAAQASA